MRQRVSWYVIQWTEKIGLLGVLVWLLMIATIVYAVYGIWPAQQQLEALLLQPKKPVAILETQESHESPADAFFANMPKVQHISSQLSQLFDVAENNGVRINEVSYKDEQKADENLFKYTMTFSVMANYPTVKAFITDALAALPYLALEQIIFERENDDEPTIAAHLTLTLYMVP